MRVFIAIPFPLEIREYLNEMICKLKENSIRGNFTRDENLHLTVAFLGEIPLERIEKLLMIMEQVIEKHSVFNIELGSLGKFIRHGECLYWCGIEENQELKNLQEHMVGELQNNAIYVDDKPFKPHITLSRRCIMKKSFKENEFIKKDSKETMEVTAIHLMKSEQIRGKLTYTSIGEIALKENG